MDRYTRHELKQDELQEALEKLQVFGSKYYRQIIIIGAAIIVAGGLAFAYKAYSSRQESAANAALQNALTTFDAYVGSAPGQLASTGPTFATAEAKYQKALDQFQAVVKKYPHTKAGAYAKIHAGICQSQLGESDAAVKTLTEAGQDSNSEIASLAKFSLAQVLAREGKTDEAAKIDQSLADHPTLNVPKATAMMALANLYRAKQPARARAIYEQLQKEFSSDQVLASAIKQDMEGLPE